MGEGTTVEELAAAVEGLGVGWLAVDKDAIAKDIFEGLVCEAGCAVYDIAICWPYVTSSLVAYSV